MKNSSLAEAMPIHWEALLAGTGLQKNLVIFLQTLSLSKKVLSYYLLPAFYTC